MATSSERAAPAGRYFFALSPAPGEALALQAAHADAIGALGGRAMPPANLHVTLAFVGAAHESALHRAAARVSGRCFDIRFDRQRFVRRSRMLWALASRTPAALGQLVNDLRGELEVEHRTGDNKPFVAHVTLVRGARATWRAAPVETVLWRCREFVLFDSRTLPGGARYEVRGRWPLHD